MWQLPLKNFSETDWNIFFTLHQLSMEVQLSCKKIILFIICSTKSGLQFQSYGWWSNIQEVALMSWFWPKFNLFIKHVQKPMSLEEDGDAPSTLQMSSGLDDTMNTSGLSNLMQNETSNAETSRRGTMIHYRVGINFSILYCEKLFDKNLLVLASSRKASIFEPDT